MSEFLLSAFEQKFFHVFLIHTTGCIGVIPNAFACCNGMLYEVKAKGCCDFLAVFDLSVDICCGGQILNITSHGCCVSSEDGTARPYNVEQDICCDTQVLSRMTHDSCDVMQTENAPAYRPTTTLYDIWCEECPRNDIMNRAHVSRCITCVQYRVSNMVDFRLCPIFPGVIDGIFAKELDISWHILCFKAAAQKHIKLNWRPKSV